MRYDVRAGLPGDDGEHTLKTLFAAQVETTVVEVLPEGATMRYYASAFEGPSGFPAPKTPPLDLTAMVESTGMPNKATLHSAGEFFVSLGAAEIVTGAKAKIGDTVAVHWQNDSKETTLDGKGKLTKLDKANKLLTVDWDLTLTPNYTVAFALKMTSIYSTDDLSLKSSEGKMTVGETVLTLKVNRLAQQTNRTGSASGDSSSS